MRKYLIAVLFLTHVVSNAQASQEQRYVAEYEANDALQKRGVWPNTCLWGGFQTEQQLRAFQASHFSRIDRLIVARGPSLPRYFLDRFYNGIQAVPEFLPKIPKIGFRPTELLAQQSDSKSIY